jgi:iron(III) transport system substrate-binding protein
MLGGRLSRVVVTGSLVLTLAGCGSGTEEQEVDASKLVIYSGRQEQLVRPLIERFEQQSGIKVSVRYGNTAQLAAQLLEEGERTKADVFFSQDGGALGALAKKSMLEPLPVPLIRQVPARFRAADMTWTGTSARARVIVYDPRQVPPAQLPNSVFALTDPRWKGKVGISPSNASFEAFVTAMRVLKGEEATRKWLADMKANGVQTFDNNVAILNAAEDGVIKLGLINHYYWFEQVAEEGIEKVPARLHYLPGSDPGSLVNAAGVGALRGTDRAEQARRFVEYLLSPDAQRYFAEKTKEYPVIAGIAPPAGLPPLNKLQSPPVNLADLDTLEQTLTMIKEAGLT